MEDNHEQFRSLATVKREADDYHPRFISPEIERVVRFFWWIVSGIFGVTILITIWVTNINGNMLGFEKRITANETYRDTAKNRFTADDLTHLQTNQQIQAIQNDLHGTTPSLIERVTEMWFMKEHGISNKEAFMTKNHYPAPNSDTESQPRK